MCGFRSQGDYYLIENLEKEIKELKEKNKNLWEKNKELKERILSLETSDDLKKLNTLKEQFNIKAFENFNGSATFWELWKESVTATTEKWSDGGGSGSSDGDEEDEEENDDSVIGDEISKSIIVSRYKNLIKKIRKLIATNEGSSFAIVNIGIKIVAEAASRLLNIVYKESKDEVEEKEEDIVLISLFKIYNRYASEWNKKEEEIKDLIIIKLRKNLELLLNKTIAASKPKLNWNDFIYFIKDFTYYKKVWNDDIKKGKIDDFEIENGNLIWKMGLIITTINKLDIEDLKELSKHLERFSESGVEAMLDYIENEVIESIEYNYYDKDTLVYLDILFRKN